MRSSPSPSSGCSLSNSLPAGPLYVLEREQWIPAPRPQVWAFFSDPGNLARITPGSLRFQIVGGPPPPLSRDSRIVYRIRWAFLTLRWITRISRWEPETVFEDVQEKGPYRRWVHSHLFTSEDGGTRMRDRVEYELPFGILGRLAHRLLVRRQLEGIFRHRAGVISELFPPAGAGVAR
ncbi:MAG: SRPBCC family protein [Thermoanaerobaculia bacterium]|nr:SRPBCC family protein [Thermoanaerobaculia bacterium]